MVILTNFLVDEIKEIPLLGSDIFFALKGLFMSVSVDLDSLVRYIQVYGKCFGIPLFKLDILN